MTTAIVKPANAHNVMEIVRDLRDKGLLQGIDFDFKYIPGYHNTETFEFFENSAEFKFYKEKKWATWFVLKYNARVLE